MKTIVLTGNPKSTNDLYKSHCRFGYPSVYMTKAGKDLKESYGWQAKSQWKRKVIDDDITISIQLYFNDNRRHDIDNYGKILLDSLTDIVWKDDSQVVRQTVSKHKDKDNPRIEITII